MADNGDNEEEDLITSEMLVMMGVIGFLAFCIIIAYVLYCCRKQIRVKLGKELDFRNPEEELRSIIAGRTGSVASGSDLGTIAKSLAKLHPIGDQKHLGSITSTTALANAGLCNFTDDRVKLKGEGSTALQQMSEVSKKWSIIKPVEPKESNKVRDSVCAEGDVRKDEKEERKKSGKENIMEIVEEDEEKKDYDELKKRKKKRKKKSGSQATMEEI